MKRHVIRFPVVMVLMVLLLAGCATFDQNAYKSLDTAKITYIQTMTALGDLYKMGKISEAQKESIVKVATVYFTAYNVAVRAYEVYHNNPTVTNQDQLIALLTDASAKLAQLLPLIQGLAVPVPTLAVPKK